MNEELNNGIVGYIDMVRNHKEAAFDEGVGALLDMLIKNKTGDLELPENPYRRKE